MTKKDYIKIADILKRYQIINCYLNPETLLAIDELTIDFMHMLERDNPRFNSKRFIDYINK